MSLMRAASLILFSALTLGRLAAEEPAKPYPAEYLSHLREALRTFQARDFDATLAAMDKADAIVPPTPTALNIRGAVAIEGRKFEEGMKYCNDALKQDPKFFPAQFNLAEIPFLQKKYAQARGLFEKLFLAHPKDDLLKFRIFMCKLLDKDEAGAKEMLDAIPFLSDSPIYYYSQAAWEFSHERREEGLKWVRSGSSVFAPNRLANFADVFFDLGWLERSKAASEEPAPEAPTP